MFIVIYYDNSEKYIVANHSRVAVTPAYNKTISEYLYLSPKQMSTVFPIYTTFKIYETFTYHTVIYFWILNIFLIDVDHITGKVSITYYCTLSLSSKQNGYYRISNISTPKWETP